MRWFSPGSERTAALAVSIRLFRFTYDSLLGLCGGETCLLLAVTCCQSHVLNHLWQANGFWDPNHAACFLVVQECGTADCKISAGGNYLGMVATGRRVSNWVTTNCELDKQLVSAHLSLPTSYLCLAAPPSQKYIPTALYWGLVKGLAVIHTGAQSTVIFPWMIHNWWDSVGILRRYPRVCWFPVQWPASPLTLLCSSTTPPTIVVGSPDAPDARLAQAVEATPVFQL